MIERNVSLFSLTAVAGAILLLFFHYAPVAISGAQDRPEEKVWQLVSMPGFKSGDAIFLASQNPGKMELLQSGLQVSRRGSEQTIEFKKITPVKYRVVVHRARANFTLVFSETFDSEWKLYPVRPVHGAEARRELLKGHKTLKGCERTQAGKDEVEQYLSEGVISTLGDGKNKFRRIQEFAENGQPLAFEKEYYSIDFISRKFQGSIQNENLPGGPFYETLLQEPVPERYHLVANGFANSWFIDQDYLKTTFPDKVKVNTDGTCDFEMVLIYRTQMLYYIGWLVTILTFLGCCAYGIFSTFKNSDGDKPEQIGITAVN